MKVLIIIPAYNEQENIERVVNNLISNYAQYDYVVVNDGSKDNTAQICKKNNFNLIDLPVNLGLAGAIQTGMRYADRMGGYDAVLQFDGDGQHRPEFIENLVNAAAYSDIVIGSRFCNKKKPHTARMLGSNILSFIIFCVTHKKISDPTSGMRLYTKPMIKKYAYEINYGPEPDTISYLIRNGINVTEVPVEMDERIAGESYLNLLGSIKYMLLMSVSILLIQRFRRK